MARARRRRTPRFTSTSARSTRRRTRSPGRCTSAAGAASTSSRNRRASRSSTATGRRTSTSASRSGRRTARRRCTSPPPSAGRRWMPASPAACRRRARARDGRRRGAHARRGLRRARDHRRRRAEGRRRGREPDVVAGLDLTRVRPRVVVVEGVAPVVGKQRATRPCGCSSPRATRTACSTGSTITSPANPGSWRPSRVPASPVDGLRPGDRAAYEAAIADVRVTARRAPRREPAAATRSSLPSRRPRRSGRRTPALRVVEQKTRARAASAPRSTSTCRPRRRSTRSPRCPSSIGHRGPRGSPTRLRRRPRTDIVAGLYRSRAGRRPDPEGLRSWSETLAGGADPLLLAEALAGSEEAPGLSTRGSDEGSSVRSPPCARAGRSRSSARPRRCRVVRSRRARSSRRSSSVPSTASASGARRRTTSSVAEVGEPARPASGGSCSSARSPAGQGLARAVRFAPRTAARAAAWFILGRRDAVRIVRDRVLAVEQQQVGALVALASESGRVRSSRSPAASRP